MRLSSTLWPLALLWLLLMAVSLLTRSYVPIDETRYVTVAWEMWLRGDFLVPHLNGETYSHKPPLLFWLFHLGWAVFGVNDWWPRLVPPLFGLGSLALCGVLARRLWPELPMVRQWAPWILFGALFWTVYTTATMFDMLVVFFTLLGMTGIHMAAAGRRSGWAWLGLAIGLGILAKGPVILLLTLPVALLAPWWMEDRPSSWPRWYSGLAAAVLSGAAIALAWAIPAALAGGKAYADAIFWGQTANRMVNSFAHRRGFFWYLPFLPILLFPWLLWPQLWRRLVRHLRQGLDAGSRFCLAWLAPVFLALSAISGKQVHYLLPLFPAFALLAARSLGEGADRPERGLWLPGLGHIALGAVLLTLPQWRERAGLAPWTADIDPAWGIAGLALGVVFVLLRLPSVRLRLQALGLGSVAVTVVIHFAVLAPAGRAYDMRPMAREIAAVQAGGRSVAHAREYAGQYTFLGRLRQPLQVIRGSEVAAWARQHPDDFIVVYYKRKDWPLLLPGARLVRDYHDGGMALWQGRALTAHLAGSVGNEDLPVDS